MLACLATLLIAAPADAGRPALYAVYGIARPVKPDAFRSAWETGTSFAGGFGYRTGPWFEFGAALSIDRFTGNGDRPAHVLLPDEDLTGATALGGEMSTLYFSLEARAFLPISSPRVMVWVLGGTGLFRRTFQEITLSSDDALIDELFLFDSDNALGVSGGGGTGVRISDDLWIAVELTYIVGLTDEQWTTYLPLRIGLTYR